MIGITAAGLLARQTRGERWAGVGAGAGAGAGDGDGDGAQWNEMGTATRLILSRLQPRSSLLRVLPRPKRMWREGAAKKLRMLGSVLGAPFYIVLW